MRQTQGNSAGARTDVENLFAGGGAADERRQKIEKEIAKLEKQARAEKQPKKKFELVQQIKNLKEQLCADREELK